MEGAVVTERTGYDLLCDIDESFGFDSDGYEVTLSADEEIGLQIIWHAIIYLDDPEHYRYIRRHSGSPTRKFWGLQ